jgi:hypothetical protein
MAPLSNKYFHMLQTSCPCRGTQPLRGKFTSFLKFALTVSIVWAVWEAAWAAAVLWAVLEVLAGFWEVWAGSAEQAVSFERPGNQGFPMLKL